MAIGDHKDIKKLDELLTKEKEDKKLIAASEYQLRKEVAENMYNSLLLAADRIYAVCCFIRKEGMDCNQQNDLEEGKKKLTEELKSRIRQIEEGYSGIWQQKWAVTDIETRISRRHPRTKQEVKNEVHTSKKKGMLRSDWMNQRRGIHIDNWYS